MSDSGNSSLREDQKSTRSTIIGYHHHPTPLIHCSMSKEPANVIAVLENHRNEIDKIKQHIGLTCKRTRSVQTQTDEEPSQPKMSPPTDLPSDPRPTKRLRLKERVKPNATLVRRATYADVARGSLNPTTPKKRKPPPPLKSNPFKTFQPVYDPRPVKKFTTPPVYTID